VGCQRIEIPLADGTTASGIICSRGHRPRKPCQVCGGAVHSVLCDFPLITKPGKKQKTCDAKLCEGCAMHVGQRDFCPDHAKQLDIAGVPRELLLQSDDSAMLIARDQVQAATYTGEPARPRRERIAPAPATAPLSPTCPSLPRLTLGGMRPGSTIALAGRGELRWTPCLTRARGDADEALGDTHAWFLEEGTVSLYCPSCRARRPRVVYGALVMIEAIREAKAAGDVARMHELVRQAEQGRRTPSSPAPVLVESWPQTRPAPPPPFRARDRNEWVEYYTERAAIAEYVGGMPRDIAEASARIQAGPCPRFASLGPLFAGAT
jgi:hypothetical protein